MLRFRRHPSRLRRDLCASTTDGAAFSLAVGAGETYLPAFILAIGGTQVVSGLVATVPLLAGAMLQLVSPAGVRLLRSPRRWVLICASIQALTFAPLALLAWRQDATVALVFVLAAVYWGASLATGPAWNAWMGRIVPRRLRADYFGFRSRVSQVAVLLGLLGGGLLLEQGKAEGEAPLRAFALLFVVAGLARGTSAFFLGRQSETSRAEDIHRGVTPLELLRRHRGRETRLLLYMLLVTFTTHVAAPFFTPLMLGEIGFSYTQFMTLIATAFVAKMVAFPALGQFARRFGADRLLALGGVAIVPLAAMWTFSHDFVYLLGLQIAAGIAWGAYELATLLMTFEAIDERERTSLLTMFNFGNAVAMVGGSLIGGFLLSTIGVGVLAYDAVFVLSTLGRAATLLLLVRLAPTAVEVLPMAIRVLALRPSAGSLDRPVLPSIPPGTHDGGATPIGGGDSGEPAGERSEDRERGDPVAVQGAFDRGK